MSSRLKSLELSGYKTFARRTVFEFANTVTSIVGPNGSGKSNIGDSLRWVLGEQSFRLLRGKKTEDMIFSGSESRSQAGMAYATITFDNTDGWLPIDFNEVAITRRAYRDGQNEYLINGQRVRLMDVSELLAQSGLAERTYTIIGQGLVDAALSLRADERRRLFEEAAGIGLHRTRREDALRRLEATQRNLERVQDILVELRPRLRSLERQVNRAEEYEETAIELSEVLREWYGYHWYNSQEILSRGHDISEEYENKLKELQHEEIDTENLIGDIRIKVRDLRDQLDKWKVEKEELRSQREVVSREIAVGNERKRLLQEQKRISTAELEKLKQRLSIQKELLISTQEEFILIEQNNKSIKKHFEELRVNYEEKQLQRGEIAQNIED
ncbi:MAG: AAA family ATPase, partial [Anaerolineales bacterium]